MLLQLGLRRRESGAERTEEVAPGVFLDFDGDGREVGVEVLSVRRRVTGTYGVVRREAEAAD